MLDDDMKDLAVLLEEEKALLLAGRVEAVAELEPRKLQLAESLVGQEAAEPTALADLQQKARRNEALLEASRNGLIAAGARLRDIRKAALNLDTYNKNGDLTNLQRTAPSFERRA